MSWSLRISNGDLSVRGAQLGVVTGEEKLAQDLRVTLLERLGTDDLHPSFGSVLDGGIRADGSVVPSIIGASNPRLAASAIESEIRRVASEYQKGQVQRVRAERQKYNKVTLTASEILVGIASIDIVQRADALFVDVKLATGAGTHVDLSVPVSSTPLIPTN